MTAEKNENKTFISVPISTLILGAKKKLCSNPWQKLQTKQYADREGKGRGRGG